MKTARTLLILAAVAVPTFAAAPTWDTSGNGLLSGTYYFREVVYVADSSGNTSRALTLYGNATFTSGAFTLTGLGGLDSGSQSGAPAVNSTGTYSLSASGYGFMTDPLITGSTISILVSNNVIMGSDTESGYNGMFVAAPSTSISTSSFQGSYTLAGYFPGTTAAGSVDATYQLNPDGAGKLNTVSISGYLGSGSTLSQSSSGVTYKVSNNAIAITYPTSTSANFYSGQVFLYISPDGNFVFGGSPTDFDMFVGVKTGGATSLSGLYYEAGVENNTSSGVDSYYGTFNAFNGAVIGYQRLLYSAFAPQGFSFYTSYPQSFSGTYNDPPNTTTYTVGQGGIRIAYGIKGYLGIGVAFPYTPPAPTGAVYIEPTGIVNTASSAPYTAGISPGDFITIYSGTNLANSTVIASTTPFPTQLGGVKVLIDGIPAPLYYVSTTQISFIVPYDVSTFPVATIQVSNNGVLSNTVTMNVNKTTPGVFTANPVGGIGIAAMLDFPASGGYYIVSGSKPAHPGDTVALYLTGLGAPFPSNPSGDVGPLSGDILVQTISVDVSGTDVGTLAYAGLAPGLAGLYQINFKIPSTAVAGNNSIGISGPDSYTTESYIPIVALTASDRPSALATPANTRRMLPRLSSPR